MTDLGKSVGGPIIALLDRKLLGRGAAVHRRQFRLFCIGWWLFSALNAFASPPDSHGSCSRIFMAIFPFQTVGDDELERLAKPDLSPNAKLPSNPKVRREHLAGQIATAALLKAVGHENTHVEYDPQFGFPRVVPSDPRLHLSITHTNNLAVAVLAPSPVGVDVEKVGRPVATALTTATTPSEHAQAVGTQLAVPGGNIPGTVALWVAKEALSKAIGIGGRKGFVGFHIPLQTPLPLTPLGKYPEGPMSLQEPGISLLRWQDYGIGVASELPLLKQGVDRLIVQPQ